MIWSIANFVISLGLRGGKKERGAGSEVSGKKRGKGRRGKGGVYSVGKTHVRGKRRKEERVFRSVSTFSSVGVGGTSVVPLRGEKGALLAPGAAEEKGRAPE